MMFKPKGQSKTAYNEGVFAKKGGVNKDKNPYTHDPKIKHSSWWDAGWSKGEYIK